MIVSYVSWVIVNIGEYSQNKTLTVAKMHGKKDNFNNCRFFLSASKIFFLDATLNRKGESKTR